MEFAIDNNQKGVEKFAHQIDKLFVKYGGKPHMGKTTLSKSSLKNYDFSYLISSMKRLDPYKLFLNEFTEQVFYENN